MTRGKFITLEGSEGVGKSSNIQFIANTLKALGIAVVTTREPGGTPIAEEIRQILLTEYEEPTLPETELLLLYAGRKQHVEHLIKPALALGKWVVCDRFFDATFAYQGAGRNIAIEKIEQLNQWALGEFSPDLTILLDAPVDIAFERIKHERKLDRFEKEKKEFFEKIRMQYLRIAQKNPHRYHVVDAAKTLVEVQTEIKKCLDNI